MKKYLLTLLVAFGVLFAGHASASLWEYYDEQGLVLPSVQERAEIYSQVASDLYVGSAAQNIALEAFLREDTLLGGTLPVAGVTYTLAGSGITASASSITLQSLSIPQTGRKLSDSDFSDTFHITLEPGNTKRQEIAACTTVTQNANGTATLSGCDRGMLPFSPYTASSTYAFSHAGGTAVIFSDPPQLFNQYTAKNNNEIIEGEWLFSTNTVWGACFGTTDFCLRSDGDNLQWSENGFTDAYNFTSSSITQLTASSTRGIQINNSEILVNASSSWALGYGGAGELLLIPSSSIYIDANGIALNTSNPNFWDGVQTFNATTTMVTTTVTDLRIGTTSTAPLVNGGSADGYHTHPENVSLGATPDKTFFNYPIEFSTSSVTLANATWVAQGGVQQFQGTSVDWYGATKLLGTGPDIYYQLDSTKQIKATFVARTAGSGAGDYKIGIGKSNSFDKSITNNTAMVGFAVSSSLYAWTSDDSGYTTRTITGFTSTTMDLFEIDYTPSSQAVFYLNGVEVATITTTLPSVAADTFFGAGGTNTNEDWIISIPIIEQEL